jgi:tyrosine-protein kinase Etk/Wzc
VNNSVSFDTTNTQVEEDEKPIDIRKILGLIQRYWYLLVFLPLFSVALAALYTRYLVNQYKISSTILIKKDDKKQGSRSAMAFDPSSLFNGNASNTTDEIEILKSRTLMSTVLTDLKINPIIYAKGRLKSAPYYNDCPISVDTFSLSEKIVENSGSVDLEIKLLDNQSFEVLKGKERIVGQFGIGFKIDSCFFVINKNIVKKNSEQKLFLIDVRSIAALSKSYLDKLAVTPIKGAAGSGNSNAILINLEDELPKRGVDIINKLIENYNRFGIEDKNSGDKNALAFIDRRVDVLTGEVNSGDGAVESYKQNNGIIGDPISLISSEVTKRTISEGKINELEIKKVVFNSLSELIRNSNNGNDFSLMPTKLVDNDPSLALQIVEYNKMVLERTRLLKFAKKENPAVVLIESQIISTRNVIQDNIDTKLKTLQQEINISLEKFKAENTVTNRELGKTPSKERGLLEITRLKNLKESIYLFLLQKKEETALSLATTVANATVLDPAISSSGPIKPNKKQIILVALLVGLIIPIIIIYIIILLNDSIETEENIRSQTSTPFLGYLAMTTEKKKQIVVEKGSRTATVETFRLLRSNLQFMLAGSNDKTVLITSSMSGEGKSFVTLNLGVSMALSGKKTIILGFDLRKPKLTAYLQNTQDKNDNEGLTNYLVGDVEMTKIVHQSQENPLLYYISSGPIPPNPAELIMQERTDKLFEYLKTQFDFVIIDTPPVGMVVDGVLLGKYASTSLYVTRFGVTKKGQLRIIDTLYREKKLPNPSIVLNAVKTGGSYGYGYGYGGYGGYGGYDTDEKKSKSIGQRLKGLLSSKK